MRKFSLLDLAVLTVVVLSLLVGAVLLAWPFGLVDDWLIDALGGGP